MTQFLGGLAELTLTLSVVIALLLALVPVLNRRFRPQWRYWVWLVLALRLAVPFNLTLHQAPVVLSLPAPAQVQAAAPRPRVTPTPRPTQWVEVNLNPPAVVNPAPVSGPAIPWTSLLFGLWLAGALVFLAAQLGCYFYLLRRLRRWRQIVGCHQGLPVYQCAPLTSPMLAGFFRPAIYVPTKMDASPYALLHEYTHHRRRDLWYKLLLVWVNAVHWFNPLVWLLRRAATRDLEICCDAQALQGKDTRYRQQYGASLLALMVSRQPAAALSTSFSGNFKGLKRRVAALVDSAPKRRGLAALTLVCAIILLVGGLVSCQEAAPTPSTALSLPDGTYRGDYSLEDNDTISYPESLIFRVVVEGESDLYALTPTEDITLTHRDGRSVIFDPDNNPDRSLFNFLLWPYLSSASLPPQELVIEVADGKLAALTWVDAPAGEGVLPEPASGAYPLEESIALPTLEG